MAASKKTVIKIAFIVCFLCLLVSGVSAESPMIINKQQEDEIINFAYKKMEASVEAFNNKIGECEKIGKKNVLTLTWLQLLPLTKLETRYVLLYFHAINEDKCVGAEIEERAIVDFVQFKSIEKDFKGKNTIKTKLPFELVCCTGLRSHYRRMWRYLTIAPEIREKLEQIPELKQPFNFIKTELALTQLENDER